MAANNQRTAQAGSSSRKPSSSSKPSNLGSTKVENGEGDDSLHIRIQKDDVRKVLHMLSEQSGLNILASPSVQGIVTVAITGGSVEEALSAILKSTGFVSRREGNYIYVGTPKDFEEMDRAADSISRSGWRANSVSAFVSLSPPG